MSCGKKIKMEKDFRKATIMKKVFFVYLTMTWKTLLHKVFQITFLEEYEELLLFKKEKQKTLLAETRLTEKKVIKDSTYKTKNFLKEQRMFLEECQKCG